MRRGRNPEEGTKPLEEVVKFFEDFGYVQVHAWLETHGDGGSITVQRKRMYAGPMEHPDVFVIPYSRNFTVRNFYQKQEHEDYLLAAEIKADQDDPDGDWEPVGRNRTSPCATGCFSDYHHRFHDYYVRVTSVAGHGSWAFPISKKEAGKGSWY